MSLDVSWIAADWGTTHLRVWAIDQENQIVALAHSDKGMSRLLPEAFEAALLELVADWLPDERPITVVACGMVGARQGWIEADYVPIPGPPVTSGRFQTAPTADTRLKVMIVPGLKQQNPADVMRGEETQIAGLLVERPGFDGTICMPGTHSKWVQVQGGEVREFKTCMTGELFSLLEQQSILKHSLGSDGFDVDVFQTTVSSALDDPGSTVMNLFSVRADDLLTGAQPSASRAKLSGYLIASEIHSARPLWQGKNILLLGADKLVTLYSVALLAAGAHVEIVDGSGFTVAGLIAARSKIEN